MSQTRRPTLARDSGRTLVGSVVSNLCNVLVILVIARTLGIGAVGQYTLAFAVRAILLLVCGLGMRTSMTRFVAAHLAHDEPGAVRGSALLGVLVPVGFSLAVAIGWFALAEPLATSAFGNPDLVVPMRVFAASLPFFVAMNTALAATQGFSDLRAYTWVGQVLEPALRLVLTAGLLLLGGGIVAASAALLVASVVTGVLAVLALVRMVARLPRAPLSYPGRELVSFGATSWVASMATQGLLWADVVILGVLVSDEQVGAYQVAARVVLVAMVVITSLTAAMAPRIASTWERGDVAATSDAYVGVVLWSARLTLPLLAGLVAVPAAVLHVFGSDFGDATTVVVLLAVGAVAEIAGAPSAVVLNYIGRNRLNMVINVAALVFNIGLNVAVIPVLGIEGAAGVWALTLVLGAVVRVVVVRRVAIDRWPWSAQLLAAIAGAAVASVVAFAAAQVLPDIVAVRLLVASVLVIGTYLLVVVGTGLTRAERGIVSREISLRWPGLRRARVRWQLRGATVVHDEILLDELISPFRVDVLARAELFQQARAHADLLREDEAAFLALVREGPYGVWFEEVLVHRGHVPGDDAAALERTFRSIVRSSLQLLERYDRLGRQALGKVTVTRVPAGTPVGEWTLGEDRWVLLDGGHRMALAVVEGVQSIGPDDYLVVEGEVPPNNTERLLSSGRTDDREGLAFLACGLVAPEERDQVQSWADLIEHLRVPDNRGPVSAWRLSPVSRT